MGTIERSGLTFKLPESVSYDEADKLLDAMEQTGKVSESNFYRILNILARVRIPVSDIPNHNIRDFGKVGIGAKTKEILLVLGASESEPQYDEANNGTQRDNAKGQKGNAARGSGLETFNGMQTTWEGLWYHPEYGGFSSASISLAQLKKFKGNVRVYVRKNKFFKQGTNRPNYNFCLKDSQSPTFTEIGIDEDSCGRLYTEEELQEAIRKATENMYTREQVEHVMWCANNDGYNKFTDIILEDYI